ncbi:Calx-beta domain-containing protein [Anaeromyxobacter sp. Fw109-5]|uniref:beta strand repeat-containing protein n=1 Tax=Anaeromyxobacter sp. (strain Fw109-5) TaxID=404589 RepID=UPI0000ED7ECD|nr:Calx-beta domain-containing protein [Anaeromyxobacter sp. Fw109-5]ABS27125.1 hypothetical protein Anae109_2925 [Anaeromyxobacter sp. Fw109-5]
MPLTQQHRRGASTVLLVIALACGIEASNDHGNDALVPVPTKPGVPSGPPISDTITPEGGTLSAADGAISISFPAGAVASPTEFTITPITNTARGAVAGAFRLGPEGASFTAPVTITFKGPEQYPIGTSIDNVGVESQDRNGFWMKVGPATRDLGANTISVKTTHFSDWTVTWQTGEPLADGPIRLAQNLNVPFDAQGRATVYLRDESTSLTTYVLAGTLTVPATMTLGTETCVPDQTTKSWANAAEIDKVRSVFRWGTGVGWTLTCTGTDGRVTTRFMPAVFDTMGINLARCAGTFDPGQYAEKDFIRGAYTADCGAEGGVRGTWDLRGHQVLVNPTSGLVTTEAGGTATFDVVLNKPPAADVVVGLSSSDTTEGTVSSPSITFTPSNWSTPQVVTVTGANDWVDDDDVAYTIVTAPATSSDPRYHGIDPADVEFTNTDDDTAGLAPSPTTGLVTTEAGGTATFQLALTSEPLADVVVALTSSDTTEGTVTASVTFTPANWNVAQTVTVTGVNDFVDEGDIGYSIALSSSSTDPKYQGLTGSVSATNTDDDTAELLPSPSTGLVTAEPDGTTTFGLTLGSEPLADVVVTLASSDTTEGTVAPVSVTFTATNWNVPQSVTVAAKDDFVADGPIAYAVNLSATSSDPLYNGLTAAASLTNADDDVAGFAATPSTGLVTTEAGGTASFGLALTSEPLAEVVVALASSDTTEGTVAPATVTFTAANWNVPQPVTITGVDDLVADGAIAYAVTLAGASTDPGYGGRAWAVAVENADNDVAGIAVGAPSATSTSEVGGAAVFTVVLTSQPTSDVTVPITSSDPTEGTVAPAPLVFTTTNWNVPQTVTVTGADDFVADGDQTYLVAIGPATSADPGYAGRPGDPADLTFTNTDDDVAGIAVGAPSAPSTSEAGTSATFTVALTSQPTSDVTVPVSSSDATEGTIAPASLVFTASNWSVAQTVTVTGVDDAVDDGDQTYQAAIGPATSADAGYAGRDPADLTFTNIDDDAAGLVASPSTGLVTTEAGGTASFQLTLASQPTADVVVAVSSSASTEGTVAPATVTFTATNWNAAQTVTVTGVDDAVADGAVAYTVNLSATSTDPGYNTRTGAVSVTNSNDDAAGIAVSAPSGLYTSEAGVSITFTVALTSQPTSDVTVPVSSSDITEGTVAPASLLFTAANWNTPQTVTVTGVDDVLDDGDQLFSALVGAAISSDPGYSGIDPNDVTLTNTDDDTAGLVASPSTGLVTNEGGGTASFQVTLASQPLADVVVAVSSSDATEGTVAPATVTFTAASWNLPQTVTITGVDDAVADGAIPYTVSLASTSTDALYNGAVGTVSVTNDDDDAAGLVASPSTGLTTTEAGGTASFQVTLASQPVADVVIALASSDTTEGTVSPATVTFTAANWNVAQSVTVAGVDDASVDGAIAYAVSLSATSTDGQYAGRTGTVSLTNTDDDAAGLVASPSAGLVTSEPAVAASFQLRLSSQPSADVVIALSSSDPTEGAVAPGSVTFTSANWNVAQTVTVTGVDDAVADGAIAYAVNLSATSTDALYGGLTSAVSVTNGDDDLAGIAVGAPSATSTSEAGTSATFTVVLTSQPTATVTVPVASSDTTEGTVAPASLVFTATNWNVAQTVTVTGVDDAAVDGNQSYLAAIGPATSADAGYAGKDPADLTFTNTDNDAVGLAASPSTGLTTTEAGGTASFQLTLTSQPSADVVVAVSSSDSTEGTVAPATVTFTVANWNVAQTVAVTGVDDAVADGAIAYAVNLSATSTDTLYDGATRAVPVTNTDDDAAGIAVGAPSATATSEAGTSATFTVVLTSQPTASVTVPVSSSDTTEGTVAPASLVFTTANWNAPQTVTVTGVDDAAVDGDQSYLAALGPATSADAAYAGRDPADLTFTNTDNDVAGLIASPSTGLVTTEAGGTASFQLTLASQPSADVVVALSSSDTTEGTVAPATVTFTAGNWNSAQTVTVTGVDDAVVDGAIAYAVNLSATSTDPGYGGRIGSVSATNNDNDAAGITVGTPSATSTSEAGTSATFTVVLTSEPTSAVTVPVSSTDTTEGTVAPATLVFTATNWNAPQTVTVTGVDDPAVDGDQTYRAAIGPATSADPGYAGSDPADLTFTNTDNDAAGLVASPATGLTTTEAGGSASFQLSLSSQPSADVVVAVSSSDASEGTVAPASVTFTSANWNTAQTVTVTGVDDAVADGPITYAVNLSATSTDSLYNGAVRTVSVTNADDDAAGIAVSPASGLFTSEAGLQVTFTVVLASQPTASVTVPITSGDLTEGTVAPAPLTFTAANWNVAQTVTVTGVDDLVDDGDQLFTVLVGASSSADPSYNGVDPGDITLTNTDDDTAALVASPTTGLMTTEAGGTASFQVALATQPLADVVVALSSSDATEGTVAPASVTFTAANWSTAQTVTITGADDALADGAIAYAVNLSATSTDPGYGGRTGSVSVTNGDNDAAGIAVGAPSATTTSEAGAFATFTVVLTSQPTADVTVPVSSNDTTEGTVAPASLLFTASNWSVPQTVTVTGVDDLVADGSQTYQAAIGPATSADPGYAGKDPADLTFTNTDDDVAGIAVGAPSATSTSETRTSATFTVVLTSQPTADVTVPVSSTDPTEGTVAPASLLFTAANWSVPQTVTVTGVDDLVADGSQTYRAAIGPATSSDAGYAGRDPADLTFTNTDDDVAGIAVGAPSATTTSEAGASATFTVVLTSQPTAEVTVPVSSSDTTEGAVAPASLVFTAANWSVAQTVTVTGVNDAVDDGDQTYQVAIGPATSSDAGYAGKDPADLTFTNTDDDAAGLVASPSTGLTTSEPAGTASFQLTLSSQPLADVVVAVSSSDPTEGTVAPASVTFTTANWNAAQTVTVTGVDDAVADGPIAYAVNLSATSTDPGYGGRTGSVSVTNADDDAAGIAVSAPSGLSTSEAGLQVTFTVVLTSEPTSDVTVPITSSDPTEGTVAPAPLTFTAANWNVAQTVTVTGVDDLVNDGDQLYTVLVGAATSLDGSYSGIDPGDISLTNTDDDAAGQLMASPSTGLVTTEAGGTATFQLTLSSPPSADVVVSLTSSNPGEGTVAPAAVTFTPADWNLAQTVTVTGVDDALPDGPIAYAVNLSAASTDPLYSVASATVSLTNADNDGGPAPLAIK